MDRDTVHERELREQWQAAHERIHEMEQEAVMLARKDVDRRLEEMNQFREQIGRERGEFMRRDVYDQQHNTLREALDVRLKVLETSKSNLEGRLWMVGAGVSAVVVGINLFLHYFAK